MDSISHDSEKERTYDPLSKLVCCSLKKKGLDSPDTTLCFLVDQNDYEKFQKSEGKYDRLSLNLVDVDAEETASRLASELSKIFSMEESARSSPGLMHKFFYYFYSKGAIVREQWGHKVEFILSLVGYAVGLGNIWRFPYLAYENGGGAFLIPYAIMLFVAGLPLFFLELCFGQFSSLGSVTIWKVSPAFKGVGFGMALISLMVSIYYNVIIMYSVYYMMVSFVSLDTKLPWSSCNNTWNSNRCTLSKPDYTILNETEKVKAVLQYTNLTCLQEKQQNETFNYTQIVNQTECAIKASLPAQEYWEFVMLRIHESSGIGDVGNVSLKNILALLVTWVIIYLCLRGGVKSSGKVVYFTATFPYLMLIILLIRGVTLPGYYKGIEFYIIPKWDRLLDVKVWSRAATQIFYSLGPAFGSLITMASYNKFHNNCYRDAIFVALINCGTSVFGGFVVFSMVGYMSEISNMPVEEIPIGGAGLVFIAYPEGLSRMPVSPLWNFLFFFMIFTLGLDSQFAMMECVISSIVDEFPRQLRSRKGLVTAGCCFVAFLLGIPCVTVGGMYVLTLMDNYTASYGLLCVCLTEVIAINWVYGFRNFCLDIKMMLGFEPGIYWKACWILITPLAIVFILIMSAVGNVRASYQEYYFEDWAQGVGWALVVLPIILILVTGIYQFFKFGRSFERIFKPTYDWGPALNEDRTDRYAPIAVSDENLPDYLKTMEKPSKLDDVVITKF
ncbi:sodium- and chloride-dependent glycine transporter 1 isoform X1 [Octopus bimaculoides]|uniref:Transporter n=1 Tax=Octopus bimaculoides TaxID=37653 RepID=A0A0L8H481_OCTBM|nr:sodium- and chloride-dependent glycine transporter 1 isoform X1 [Octopus bimaculoides]|eukprot:XP_014775516.1 PREDICTED: sodium- and chloride-dependent glycine transporter 1-like isoform X1 [Octopus bimaculoides]